MVTKTEVDILNRTHRFASKRIHRLGPRSEVTIGSIGLWFIEDCVNKRKLLFFGNLCHAECTPLHKHVLLQRLFTFLYGCAEKALGFIPDIYRLLIEYDLVHWIDEFLLHQQFPSKLHWKVVIEKIEEAEANAWRLGISSKPELEIYGYVH